MTPAPSTKRSVVSRTILPHSTVKDCSLIKHLRTLRATGRVTIDVSQGGVNSVTFEAKYELNGHDNVELKFLPGIDLHKST